MNLDLITGLPRIRAAFDAKTLQTFTGNKPNPLAPSCQYAGPCAVGVMMDLEEAAALDALFSSKTILSLITSGRVIVPDDQVSDFCALQSAHDNNEGLGQLITELEAKYAR